MHLEPLADMLGHLLELAAVVLREDDLADAGARAAISFSRMPPTGKTSPVKVISPVMASRRMGWLRASERRADVMVMPAEGPSLGVAPAGTWTWMKAFSKKAGSAPSSAAWPTR